MQAAPGASPYVSTTARETVVLYARTGVLDWRFADGYYSPLVVAGERAILVGKGRILGDLRLFGAALGPPRLGVRMLGQVLPGRLVAIAAQLPADRR